MEGPARHGTACTLPCPAPPSQTITCFHPTLPFDSIPPPHGSRLLSPGRFVPPQRLVLASAAAGATWSVALSLRAHAPPAATPAAAAPSPSPASSPAPAHRPPPDAALGPAPALLLLRRPKALAGAAAVGRTAGMEEGERRRRRGWEEGEGAAAWLRIQGLAFSP